MPYVDVLGNTEEREKRKKEVVEGITIEGITVQFCSVQFEVISTRS